MRTLRLLDSVALIENLPGFSVVTGEVGAVVEVLSNDAFEVEFCDAAGQTHGLHALRAH